jgi:hypothetical protein
MQPMVSCFIYRITRPDKHVHLNELLSHLPEFWSACCQWLRDGYEQHYSFETVGVLPDGSHLSQNEETVIFHTGGHGPEVCF